MSWNDPSQLVEREINGLTLKLTCSACPEQYDVFLDGRQVGYLRLRHGYFSADYPDCDGQAVYEAEDMRGEGMFEPEERTRYLTAACDAILAAIAQNR